LLNSISRNAITTLNAGARLFGAACAEIERCAGTQFDPMLVRVFIAAVHQAGESGVIPAREATI
jgi:hypothetical protein